MFEFVDQVILVVLISILRLWGLLFVFVFLPAITVLAFCAVYTFFKEKPWRDNA